MEGTDLCQLESSGAASCLREKPISTEIKVMKKKGNLPDFFWVARPAGEGGVPDELGCVAHIISILQAGVRQNNPTKRSFVKVLTFIMLGH